MAKMSKLAKGSREYLAAQWPANEKLGRPEPIPVKLQVLTEEEIQESISEAKTRMRELRMEGQEHADELEGEVAVQLLARACRDFEQPASTSFVVDAADLRGNTTPWERAEVVAVWRTWQEPHCPLRPLTAEERRVVEDAVKKKAATTLKVCGLDTLVTYMLTSDSPPST